MGRIQHAIDAGRGRRELDRVLDCGVSERKRSFRHRLGGLLDHLGQPRFLLILGGRGRGIDVGGGKILRRPIACLAAGWLARARGRRV